MSNGGKRRSNLNIFFKFTRCSLNSFCVGWFCDDSTSCCQLVNDDIRVSFYKYASFFFDNEKPFILKENIIIFF